MLQTWLSPQCLATLPTHGVLTNQWFKMVFAVVLTWQSESDNDVPHSQVVICNQSIGLQQVSQRGVIIHNTQDFKCAHNGGSHTKMSILLGKWAVYPRPTLIWFSVVSLTDFHCHLFLSVDIIRISHALSCLHLSESHHKHMLSQTKPPPS